MSCRIQKPKRQIQSWQIVGTLLAVYDFAAIAAAYFAALWIRFDCRYQEIPENYLHAYFQTILFYCTGCVLVHALFRLYKSIWKFAGYHELLRALIATAATASLYMIVMFLPTQRMPVSYHLFGTVIQFVMIVGIRFIYRFVNLLRGGQRDTSAAQKRLMIVGAGRAGRLIQRDLKLGSRSSDKLVCFIDDDPNKIGRYIDGIPVVGNRSAIPQICKEYQIEKIYITIPSAKPEDIREILDICNATDCELMNLPGMYQIYNKELNVSHMKAVSIEDLLGREPIKTNTEDVLHYVQGRTILVTGGGGSIGSELCRQIASHHPQKLIIFDIYENNAYDIQLELKRTYPELDLETIIGSVRDSRKIFQVFEQYHPEIVYHAAAHKHVPLMEDSACEAIKNNALGTYKTAYAAMSHGCQRFVLISTDKAVNPTNIMGASKRLCEMIIQAFDQKIKEGQAYKIPQLFTHGMDEVITSPEVIEALKNTKTEFVAVRFGNVLGSNGSVIPLFKKQIENGGPVTVTHPDIIRYFMTIPEAVGLVLQAGTYAHGGEIFVLDMGEPVKIDTLARNLIRKSGLIPGVDIEIKYTGLRPGEKLFEEKLMAEEGLKKTDNDLIHIGCPIPFDVDVFLTQLDELMEAAYKNKEDIRDRVQAVVSTYHPA